MLLGNILFDSLRKNMDMNFNYFVLFGILLIFGLSSIDEIYAPSPPTPPSQANLAITTEINSNTITGGLIIQNQNYNYTITVTNSGPASASDVEVITILPSQLSLANVNATCSSSSQTHTCQLGTITSSGTKIIEFEVTPDSLGGVIPKSNVTSSTFDKTPQGFAFSKIFKSLTGAKQVAVDSSNNVIVAESSTDLIYKYDIHGTELASETTNRFSFEAGNIDFDTSGNILIADRSTSFGDILRWNSNLGSFTTWIPSLTAPSGLAINSTGHIFLGMVNNDQLRIYDSTPTLQQTLTVTPSDADTAGPFGVAVNATHAFVASFDDDGEFEIFDLATNSIVKSVTSTSGSCNSLGRFSNNIDVKVDAANNIYLASAGCRSIQVFDASLNPLFHYGIGSSTATEFFQNIGGIALNGTGWLYAPDTTSGKVSLLQPLAGISSSLPGTVLASAPSSGDFIQSLTKVTSTDGIVNSPFGYAAHAAENSAGEIFVADNTNNVIQKFDSNGVFQSNFISGISLPDDVVIDSNDRVIVASQGQHTVQVFTSAGVNVTSALIGMPNSAGDGDNQLNDPHAVAVDSSDNIYVVDRGNDKIKVYDSAGNYQKTITGGAQGGSNFGQPEGIAIDSNNRLLISDSAPPSGSDSVQIFSSSDVFIQSITNADGAGGTFSDPHKLSIDSHDRIYVGDSDNDRIQIFDSAGTFEKSITVASGASPTTFGSIPGFSVGPSGKIFVADGDNNRVQIFKALDAPVTETTTTQTQAEISAASDSDASTQEIAEAAAAEPDETFELPEEEYAEVVAESLATPIVEAVKAPIVETFEEVKAPEKVEAAPEDTSFKVLTKVLSKSDDKEDDAKKMGLEYKEGDVRALVILDKESDAVINEIKKFANIESLNSDLVQINIPLDDLSTLYKIPDIAKVQPTTKAIQNALTSQGYDKIKANIPHEIGVKADGIKIAVLDLAFDVTNDEIKNNIVDSKTFRHDFDGLKIPLEGFGHEKVHGTAVSEIVIDIAPNAELFLYTFAAEVEFLDAMDYAMQQNVDLITMSAGWVNYPTDGTSEMTKKVEQAISKGIPFVVSAGNYAETHWEGNYIDMDSNGWHEFAPSDEGISVVATQDRVDQQIPFILYLMWSSPSGTIYDFDLSMTDEEGDVIAYSANLQESANAINFEYVYFTPETPGTYSLGILYGGDVEPDVSLELFSPSDKLEYPISAGSISVPTDAKGVISVGALNYYDSRLEPFSSRGPTNHCVQAPSVMGPDAVMTLAYDQAPFYGTSAAAPHVAGMVALMLDKTPQLTPLQILSELVSNTDTEFESYENLNNVFGHGAADSEFIAVLDEIVDPITLDDGCMLNKSQTSERYGDSDQQSKFAVAGVITQQGIEVDDKVPIPEWVKKNAGWWSDGTITDDTFTNAIGFLIEKQILDIPMDQNVSVDPDEEQEIIEEVIVPIPDWIKNNAGWWSDGTINDDAFISAIQYLVEKGILDV